MSRDTRHGEDSAHADLGRATQSINPSRKRTCRTCIRDNNQVNDLVDVHSINAHSRVIGQSIASDCGTTEMLPAAQLSVTVCTSPSPRRSHP